MMERTSLNQNWILRRTACRGGPGLRPAAMNTPKDLRATTKHTKPRWEITPQPVLAAPTSHYLSPQTALTGAKLCMLSP